DLARGPLYRATLVNLGPEDKLLMITMHHIVTDGWSMDLFFRELAELYEVHITGKESTLPELPIQYADYAAWQREWLQGDVLASQLAYWTKHLKDAPALLALPSDRPHPPVQTYNGASVYFVISSEVSDALKKLSQSEGATLFMTLLAAFKVLLYKQSGQSDILVGTPMGNRSWPEIENLIGFFLNTVVLRSQLADQLTFRELLAHVRTATVG